MEQFFKKHGFSLGLLALCSFLGCFFFVSITLFYYENKKWDDLIEERRLILEERRLIIEGKTGGTLRPMTTLSCYEKYMCRICDRVHDDEKEEYEKCLLNVN